MENDIVVTYKDEDLKVAPKTPLYDKIEELIEEDFCDSEKTVDCIELTPDKFATLKDEMASKFSYIESYWIPSVFKSSLRTLQPVIEEVFKEALTGKTEFKVNGVLIKELV